MDDIIVLNFKVNIFNLSPGDLERNNNFLSVDAFNYVVVNNNAVDVFLTEKIQLRVSNFKTTDTMELEFVFYKNNADFLKYSIFPVFFEISKDQSVIHLVSNFKNDDFISLDFLKEVVLLFCENRIDRQYWFSLSKSKKIAYLRVGYYHITTRPESVMELSEQVELDGKYIISKQDFLCHLGEEVNGILGYFGGCFDSLSDALTGGLNELNGVLRIKWINFSFSKEYFDDKNDLEVLLEILSQYSKLQLID
mgnify:CR=1 FL=1